MENLTQFRRECVPGRRIRVQRIKHQPATFETAVKKVGRRDLVTDAWCIAFGCASEWEFNGGTATRYRGEHTPENRLVVITLLPLPATPSGGNSGAASGRSSEGGA